MLGLNSLAEGTTASFFPCKALYVSDELIDE